MSTKPQSPLRELDRRTNDGIEVSLLWNSQTGGVSVAVEDARRDESFEFEVDPSQALPAFFHPYAHAPATTTITARCWLADAIRGLPRAHDSGQPNLPATDTT